jgi:alpha-glucosidase (family GH31 glycosyl hydrolase)
MNKTVKGTACRVALLPGEFWWGGRCADGWQMPYSAAAEAAIDLHRTTPGQGMPLFLSSLGRVLWFKAPGVVRFCGGVITAALPFVLTETGGTLADAYRTAAKMYFRQGEGAPDDAAFAGPMYSGWIAMGYHPTQQKVLDYARTVRREGLGTGVLILDEGWMRSYGDWDFDTRAFPDPAAMVRELHEMGFRVMLWLVPYVTASGIVWLEAKNAGVLRQNPDGTLFYKTWWDGVSCELDLTKPAAAEWLKARLDHLQSAYGIDGFKFDGCDPDDADNAGLTAYCRLGESYGLCELRESYLAGGGRMISRQHDKFHSWGENGLTWLIPNGIAQSLMGYLYHCPDMVGGGEIQNVTGDTSMDGELFLRFAQCSALFPCIQFSRLPSTAVDEPTRRLVLEALEVRKKFLPRIRARVAQAARTQEPVFAPMEYYFPQQSFAEEKTQFCLGPELIVAPVLEKDAHQRTVQLPQGSWQSFDGGVYAGGSHCIPVTAASLPWFVRRDAD